MKKILSVVLGLLLFTAIDVFAGNLERSYDFGDKEIYSIIQNGHRVGYADVGFHSGHVVVSVINTTGRKKYVKVECEQNHASSASNVAPGSLKMVNGVGLVANKPSKFRVTRDFCGWGAINITFK